MVLYFYSSSPLFFFFFDWLKCIQNLMHPSNSISYEMTVTDWQAFRIAMCDHDSHKIPPTHQLCAAQTRVYWGRPGVRGCALQCRQGHNPVYGSGEPHPTPTPHTGTHHLYIGGCTLALPKPGLPCKHPSIYTGTPPRRVWGFILVPRAWHGVRGNLQSNVEILLSIPE